MWAGIKSIYCQYAFVGVVAKFHPLPTSDLTDKHATFFITRLPLF